METLVKKLADLEEQETLALVQKALDDGVDALEIFDACRQGMVMVGDYFKSGEYFVSDLMMASEIFKTASEMIKPSLQGVTADYKGKVVIGTVQGDIHDIGKDLTAGMLASSGFEVFDLGVSVPPADFITKLQETGARVLALSGLLTIAFDAMKATVDAVQAAGLDVKVMIGGGPVTEQVRARLGRERPGGCGPGNRVDGGSRWISKRCTKTGWSVSKRRSIMNRSIRFPLSFSEWGLRRNGWGCRFPSSALITRPLSR